MQQKKLIEIGRVVRSRGLAGELKVLMYSDSPERILDLEYVYLSRASGVSRIRIMNAREDGVHAYITLESINDPKEAKALVRAELFIDDSQLRPLSEGEYYQRDLMDCQVLNEAGQVLGQVDDLLEVPQGLLLAIKPGGGLIPFREEFVLRVDLEQKQIHVQLPSGLLEATERSDEPAD